MNELKPRRRLWTQSEIMQRPTDAARAQFANRGYAAATTREIAREADVSETLLFRHFGSKSALFDPVIVTPFNALARQLLALDGQVGGQPSDGIKRFLAFSEQNRQVMLTLAAEGPLDTQDGRTADRVEDIHELYQRNAELIAERCRRTGIAPAVRPEFASRLGFGMALAAVLFEDWLFPEGAPDRDGLAQSLEAALRQLFAMDYNVDR